MTKNKILSFLFCFHFSCYSMHVSQYPYTLAIISAFIEGHDIDQRTLFLNRVLDPCCFSSMYITLRKNPDLIIFTTTVSISKKKDTQQVRKNLSSFLLEAYHNNKNQLDRYTNFHTSYKFSINSETAESVAIFETKISQEDIKNLLS